MSEVTRRLMVRVGVDIAKQVVHVHAVDGAGRRVVARALKRDQFLPWCVSPTAVMEPPMFGVLEPATGG